MRVLVTGIGGFIGGAIAPRLLADGHEVRGFARTVPAAPPIPGLELVIGDAITGAGLDVALRDIDVAYYLIHSMERASSGSFSERERLAAGNFARSARAAGVRRIVYLGGLVPQGQRPSPHLASRLVVEQSLLEAAPDSVAFRASIVIGARSRSFRFLVRLVERLPVLVVPAWRVHRTAPIDERDVITYLMAATADPRLGGQSLDIAGPEIVTYGELIDRIREEMLVARPTIGLSRLKLTPIASRVSAIVAGEQRELIGPLMESLETDLLPRDTRVTRLLDVRLHSLNAAIERALRDWEAVEPLRAR